MTDPNHPVMPSNELIRSWENKYFDDGENLDVLLIAVYQAGADQELQACCEVLGERDYVGSGACGAYLRAARRPKPPSLKEQALKMLDDVERFAEGDHYIIRRALEQLPND